VEAVQTDYTQAKLTPRQRAILDYAVKLTQTPSSMTREDADKLRSQGLSDKDILDVILVACIFNYNDRMADATGIKREDFLNGLVSAEREV
jgi:uncharacterized peroxidase-related enzyme